MDSEQANFQPAPMPGQPAHSALPPQPGWPPQPAAAPAAPPSRPGSGAPPRKALVAGVIVILLIIAAIIGHAVASGSSIAVGDCVVTTPSVATGWDIKKVACDSNPGSALMIQKVVSVQSGPNGQCDLGLTTFQDDPANETYCLSTYSLGG